MVEDTDWIRAGMARALLLRGYRILEAADADEAVHIAAGEPPDLILTEERLPTLAALQEQLRRCTRLRDVPVVIVNPDEEEGTRYGDIIVLPGYDQVAKLLPTTHRRADHI